MFKCIGFSFGGGTEDEKDNNYYKQWITCARYASEVSLYMKQVLHFLPFAENNEEA